MRFRVSWRYEESHEWNIRTHDNDAFLFCEMFDRLRLECSLLQCECIERIECIFFAICPQCSDDDISHKCCREERHDHRIDRDIEDWYREKDESLYDEKIDEEKNECREMDPCRTFCVWPNEWILKLRICSRDEHHPAKEKIAHHCIRTRLRWNLYFWFGCGIHIRCWYFSF